ncbi:MAG: hypothetical protein ABTQ32_32055 [Myxococcaceae bacterium]
MQPTRRQRLEVALEALRNDGSGAQTVFEWFGERDAERTEAWLRNAETTLQCLEDGVEQPYDLRGDWVSALPAASVFARQGAVHPLAAPFVEHREDVTTLGRGSAFVTVFRGPVRLKGRVHIDGMVVIIGDLEVDGFIEHFTDPGDCLMVLGNETVTSVSVGWAHFVMGALNAQVRFFSYGAINEGLMHVTGATSVALDLEDQSGGDEPERWAVIARLLEPPIDGAFDGNRVCELVASGACRVVGGPYQHRV